MSVRQRSLVIAYLGPGLQIVGFAWEALHLLLVPHAGNLGLRHLLFEGPVLLIIAGLILSIIVLPVALDVARADAREVLIPVFGPEGAAVPEESRPALHLPD